MSPEAEPGALESLEEVARLVTEAKGGDRRALNDLLQRHQAQLYAVCRRVTGNDADAADASQEALLAIVRNLARFDGRARFSTWAYRIAVNASLDELRRRKRRPEPREQDDDVRVRLLRGGGEGAHPEDAALRLDVDAALRGLPPDFRAAVVLRDLCGLDYAEIADVLGIPPGTVRSRISRGRAALAPALGNQDDPPRRHTGAPAPDPLPPTIPRPDD